MTGFRPYVPLLLSLAVYVTGLIESRIRTSRTLSPSVQVLFVKSLKIVLIGLAILIAIDSVGIDLTALAVFGGAIGVGILLVAHGVLFERGRLR